MRVVLVEDDYLQAESISAWLREAWPHVEIDRIETEYEFRSQLTSLSAHPPDVVIIDVMLRWNNPSLAFDKPPDEIQREGSYRAGLRCVELLKQNVDTERVPVVLYSVLDEADVEAQLSHRTTNVRFLPKSSEPYSLVRLVGSLVAVQKSIKQPLAMSRDVFVCHATEDRDEIVNPLISAFEASGITVWHDRAEIRWGDSLFLKIKEGLRISRYVLAILSKHSVGKPWPLRELDFAVNHEILTGDTRVLPLVVGTARERKAILQEFDLQDERRYEVWTGDIDSVVQRLSERLK